VSENGNHHFLKRQILAFNWRKKLSKKLGVVYLTKKVLNSGIAYIP
jgi:hypothetical protein